MTVAGIRHRNPEPDDRNVRYTSSVEERDSQQHVVRVQRLPHADGLDLPTHQTPGSAGADVRSAANLTVAPGERAAIPTGLVFAIPLGWEIQVRPRSGLAWKHGLTVVNAPGTIDADFRGEVKVLVVNLGDQPVVVGRGDRVAQLVLSPVHRATYHEVEAVDATDRGVGGFGSTGVR
jgi:dUTP pyrophosphatase